MIDFKAATKELARLQKRKQSLINEVHEIDCKIDDAKRAIQKARRESALSKRRDPKSRNGQIATKVLLGLSMSDAAQEYGLSTATIKYALHKFCQAVNKSEYDKLRRSDPTYPRRSFPPLLESLRDNADEFIDLK